MAIFCVTIFVLNCFSKVAHLFSDNGAMRVTLDEAGVHKGKGDHKGKSGASGDQTDLNKTKH